MKSRPRNTTQPTPYLFLLASLVLASNVAAHRATDERIDELSFQIELAPRSTALLLKRAELHRQSHHWVEARADIEKSARLDPSLEETDSYLARIAFESGHPEEANRILDVFLVEHPRHLPGLLTRARSLRRLGKLVQATADYKKVIDLDPEAGPAFYLELAGTFQEAGPRFAARGLAVLDRGLERLGPLVVLEELAVELALEQGSLEDALRRIDDVLIRLPSAENWLLKRGDVLTLLGSHEQARSSYKKALEHLNARPERVRRAAARRVLARSLRQRLQEASTHVARLLPSVAPHALGGRR